jgi:hypothetical protein
MGRKILQDVANTLPNMLVARMHLDDLETLALLPDGTLSLDLLSLAAHHSLGGVIELKFVEKIAAWLKTRLIKNRILVSDLSKAELVVVIRTDKILTDRTRIIAFDLSITCAVGLLEGRIKTSIGSGRIWYDRIQRRQSEASHKC